MFGNYDGVKRGIDDLSYKMRDMVNWSLYIAFIALM